MVTASEILSAIAPQFDDASGRQTLLDLSESRTSSTFFGTNRPEAVAYRAAHMLDMATNATALSGSSGPMTSKKEGDLSVSFGTTQDTGDSAYLSQTAYGRMLLDLMRSSGPATSVTGQPFTPVYVLGGGW